MSLDPTRHDQFEPRYELLVVCVGFSTEVSKVGEHSVAVGPLATNVCCLVVIRCYSR